ncbi:transglutaminase family protein [Thalassococcus sp. CAU 1522]|uniref:Transglutaminase family protein n=1 Tax=Thalassococcus arenae TaxID=2851652 RepID=A0ABS6N2C8_9RHOB|nr:transglutaminase family protein [Thalassococcus arenae]MBV2358176.1 transglutaminase family protein [Thalassococcus arenae]
MPPTTHAAPVQNADPLLAPTEFLDHDDPSVAAFAEKILAQCGPDPREQAVALFYAVRDGLFYEIYNADFSRGSMKASAILKRRSGLCIHKSLVYAALLRHAGIPSRLWLTDVKNHLCSPQLERLMGTKIFHYHALVSLRLDGRWYKATPVFNARLCQLYGMAPLEFDGYSDCVHHAYDLQGRAHMEIMNDHGEFDDLPYDTVMAGLRKKHASLFKTSTRFKSGSLLADIA